MGQVHVGFHFYVSTPTAVCLRRLRVPWRRRDAAHRADVGLRGSPGNDIMCRVGRTARLAGFRARGRFVANRREKKNKYSRGVTSVPWR